MTFLSLFLALIAFEAVKENMRTPAKPLVGASYIVEFLPVAVLLFIGVLPLIVVVFIIFS